MSKIKNELIEILADYFWREFKSYELEDELKSYDIIPDDTLSPNDSKRNYSKSGLNKFSEKEIIELSKRISKDADNVLLNKALEKHLNDNMFEFSFVTRKKLVEFFDKCNDFEGNMCLDELLRGIWDIDAIFDSGDELLPWTRISIGEYLHQHVVESKDMSYKDMLQNVLDIKYISDRNLMKFLEKMVNPEVRMGEDQKKYVNGINDIIRADGYELAISGSVSNEPVYKLFKISNSRGNMRNLIFAPINRKPDIVIDDAIANDLRIVNTPNNCLLYDFEPNADGLLWKTLVKWWEPRAERDIVQIQNDLFARLQKSLDSVPESFFFTQYYKLFKDKENLPALLPQVYLHYDPHAKSWRGNSVIYTHQRMDFLMLAPNGIRIIFEIDGQQHYSKDGKPSSQLYAEMVADTRDLQLKGYEVYIGNCEMIQ